MRTFVPAQSQSSQGNAANPARPGVAVPARTHEVNHFSQKPLQATSRGWIQTKLAINTPGDVYEQEADRVAEQVVQMPVPRLQRACACGGGCPRCETSQVSTGANNAQLKRSQPSEIATPSFVQDVLVSSGQPLTTESRAFFEPRFGHDFSHVRVHASGRAAESAQALNALAYTAGSNIVFANGRYAPGTTEGKRLLAHELTHVVQQNGPDVRTSEGVPAIQRQSGGARESRAPARGAGGPGANIRQEYVRVICEVIAGLRSAIEQGRTWYFENDILLQGDEWLQLERPLLVEQRRDALMELVRGLDSIIGDLESGTLTPTAPATRTALEQLWEARNPRSIRALAERWTPIFAHVRLRSGRLQPLFPSLSWYIADLAGSPPGVLQPAPNLFPTWWVTSCVYSDPQQPRPEGGPVPEPTTPQSLGLVDPFIYVTDRHSRDPQWDWEPRGSTVPLINRFDWYYDARGVFIIMDGRRMNLLPLGRLEAVAR